MLVRRLIVDMISPWEEMSSRDFGRNFSTHGAFSSTGLVITVIFYSVPLRSSLFFLSLSFLYTARNTNTKKKNWLLELAWSVNDNDENDEDDEEEGEIVYLYTHSQVFWRVIGKKKYLSR